MASLGTVLHHHVEEILSSRSMQQHGSSVGCGRGVGDDVAISLRHDSSSRSLQGRRSMAMVGIGFGCCWVAPARRPCARASCMSREARQRLMRIRWPMASSLPRNDGELRKAFVDAIAPDSDGARLEEDVGRCLAPAKGKIRAICPVNAERNRKAKSSNARLPPPSSSIAIPSYSPVIDRSRQLKARAKRTSSKVAAVKRKKSKVENHSRSSPVVQAKKQIHLPSIQSFPVAEASRSSKNPKRKPGDFPGLRRQSFLSKR